MPDNIKDWRSKLRSGASSSAVDYDARNNQTTRNFQSITDSQVVDYEALQAEELKKQSKKLDSELAEYGFDDKALSKIKESAEYWNDLFNTAKASVGATFLGGASFLQQGLVDMDKKKKEILESADANRRQANAIKNNTVVNDITGEVERFDEQPLDSKTWADKFKGIFGFGSDTFGDKKLTIGHNPISPLENGDKWFFYLDKDEGGSDIWRKTKYKDHEEFKKIGDKVVGAYGVAPFKTGFWREFNNQVLSTYANLEKNAVNFGEAAATLTTGDSGLLGAMGIKTKSTIQNAADKYRDEFSLTESKQGTGDSVAEWMGGGLGSGVSSLLQMGALGKVMSGVDKLDKFRALTNFGAGAFLNFNESYESALKSGVNKQDAATIGMVTGVINGVIESAVGTNKLVNWVSGGGDRVLARAVIKELNGDVSQKSITKVLNSWRNNTQDKIADLFNTPIVGTALEEGIEEFSQTFSQKGVENLYDIFFADDKKQGEGKFGTEVFSKESLKEGLEAAFFGALVGGGMGGMHTVADKLTGKKQSSDQAIMPFIADGKRSQVEAMVKSLHSSKLISDTQRETYLKRVEQLDNLYKENEGTFKAVDEKYDEATAQVVKSDALSFLATNLHLNRRLEDLNKKITQVNNDSTINTPDKKARLAELNKEVRNAQLNIRFNDEQLEKDYTPQADGKIYAAENKFENVQEIAQNKWQRFVTKDNLSLLETEMAKYDTEINVLTSILSDPEGIVDQAPSEAREMLNRAQSNLDILELKKKDGEKIFSDLITQYNEITSQEYQDNYKAKKNAVQAGPIVAPIITPPSSEDENEDNSNKQEDDANKPLSVKEQLEEEQAQLQAALEDENISQEDKEAISTRLEELNTELKDVDDKIINAHDTTDQYISDVIEKFNTYSTLDAKDVEASLTGLKEEIENMIPALEAHGVDTTSLKQLYGQVNKRLAGAKEELRLTQEEADRIAKEASEAKKNDGNVPVSSINFFDRLQRTKQMNGRLTYYKDEEVRQIFLNTPMDELLSEIEIAYLDGSKFMAVGAETGSWNTDVKYVNPPMIVTINYRGKSLGNIQQFDGMTVNGKLLTEDLTDEEFAKIALNVSREEFEASKVRSIKMNTLLKQKGVLISADLQSLGFILNWNGDFAVNTEVGRILVKDFKEAQLVENNGKPYIYDTVNNLAITEGTVNMRNVEGVPALPELGDRYLVLVKANNGKYYWVGAQNQVLTDKAIKDMYDEVLAAVGKYKAITDPEAQKKFVGDLNRKLEATVHVAIPNAQLVFTTPNARNPKFTLRLAVRGAKNQKNIELDPSINPTFTSMLSGLGIDRTDLRVPMANNAPARIAITKLAVNLKAGVLENENLHKEVTFGVDENKLNAALLEAPVAEEEVFDPFAEYDAEKSAEVLPEAPVVAPVAVDLSNYDANYAGLSDDIKAKILDAVREDIETATTSTNKLKVRGAITRIKAEIAKYTTGIDPVFSLGTAPEIIDYKAAEQWIKDHLPVGISVKDVEVLLGKIRNNGVTWGAFANSTIYLAQNASEGTQYHEAFHAVFRLLMNDSQINAAYKIAEKKYGKPSAEAIEQLRMSSSVYQGYTQEELYNLVLEEKMANEFKKYQLNYLTKETSGLKSLWNKIRNWISFITGNKDSLEALFYNINRGKFKKASYKSNMFSSFANQDKVFEIYQKGTDEQGNIITTLQAEAAGIVAVLTNRLLAQTVAESEGGTKVVPTERRNEILDKLIADQAKFYSIDENPFYADYLEAKGLSDDEEAIDEMARELELKRNIYVLPQNIEKIKKDVFNKMKLFDIESELDMDELQKEIDDKGERYEVSPWTIGGETSFSKVLREYISLITIKRTDKYGQEYEEAVDFRKIYRGLIRALAGTEEENVIPRMAAMAEFDDDINAVLKTLKNDLGLTPDNNKHTDITKGYDLWRKFVTAFNNEKVGWYTVLYSNQQARVIESNTMSNKEVQFNNWFQDYIGTFEDAKSDQALRNRINNTVDEIQLSANINVKTLAEAKAAAKNVQSMFNVISIRLSQAYIAYSILRNSDYATLDQPAKDMLSAFAGVPSMYEEGNIPFIVTEFKSGYNPFESTKDDKGKERGAVTRIKQLADDNSIFDPTIGENSFQNADGKNVYSIIRPSFGLVKLRWLADTQKRANILNKDKNGDNFINPVEGVNLNHLLADENVNLILQSLYPSLIDGTRKTSFEGDIIPTQEEEGVTFGKFDGSTYLLSDLRMFLANRKSVNKIDENSGKTVKIAETAMFNINQMESSNTAYAVFLPVNDFKTINSTVTDILFNYFAQEAIRVNKVRNEFGKPGTTLWKGYNTKETDRGFKLMEFAGYDLESFVNNLPLGLSAEEVYGTLIGDKEAIVDRIKTKVEGDINEFKDTLKASNIIGEKSSLLPPMNVHQLGYVPEKVPITEANTDSLITDFYLNSYINTLGINNLLLDNYARKVKDTVDWFKRAKGIIGSGPDLGSGVTRVAVYKDPTAYINDKLEDVEDPSKVTNVVVSTDKYTRQSAEADTNTMYLFTDNAERTSSPAAKEENVDKDSWYYQKYKGQTNKPIHFGTLNNPTSAVIRGLNNAYPISTMSAYGTNWTTANFDLFKSTIDDEIAQIKQDMTKFKTLKLGDFRIGQGGRFAKLPAEHQAYLDAKLLELGIDNSGVKPVVLKKEQVIANKIDVADAQSYVTLDHKILQLKRWGRFPVEVEKIYNKISAGQDITWVDYQVLTKNNAALNSAKTVAYNGEFYFKLSELALTPRLVGATDKEGNVIMENDMPKSPKKGFEYLFNMYHSMVSQGVDQALPETASKMATIKSAEHNDEGKFDFTQSIMEIENKFKRLQVETPTGKSKIIHGTQLIQLITNEQDDSIEIDFPYNSDIKTIGDLRAHFRRLMADTRYESFHQAMAYIKDPLSGEFNSKELTKKFYNTVVESGSDEVMTNFFTPDQNGERQFNWNLGPIVNKAEQLFLAHFSKGVLSQKVAGLKVSLVSDAGIFKENGEKLKHMALDADGNYYSECMLPAFANELLGKDPSDKRIQEVLKMFGVRIPTQDKHSMMSLKVVGFLPVEYGSVGIFPKEIVYLSGADFDIDSEFIHRKEFYNVKGQLIPYGLATTDEGRFDEWKRYELSHNKMLASKFKEFKASDLLDDVDLNLDSLEGLGQLTPEYLRAQDITSALKSLGLPSTLEEFVAKNPINIAAANNAMVEAQIKLLTNKYVREGAATIPSSMDSIKAVAKTIVEKLELDSQRAISPNTPLARYRANRSNMEGSAGIGPVAIANVVHSLLSTYNVALNHSVDRLNISGRISEGFAGIYTIDKNAKNRKNDNISTLLSAMTDNAKEQLAKLLNLSYNKLSTDTLPVATYMLALGYTMEETMLFMNLPTIRQYATNDKLIAEKLHKLQIKLNDKIAAIYKPQDAEAFRHAYMAYDLEHRKPFTLELLIDSLNEDKITDEDDMLHLNHALDMFGALKIQGSMMNSVSALMQINKGMKSNFDDNGTVIGALNKLQLNFVYSFTDENVESYDDLIQRLIDADYIREGKGTDYKYVAGEKFPPYEYSKGDPNKTPFDARLALLNDPNTIQNVIIHKKIMESSKSFFLLNTPVFQVSNTITGIPSKELIPFFMDKAYTTFLEEVYPEKYANHQRYYDNAGYMINKTDDNIGIDLANLKKNPKFKNNLLIKMLQYSKPSGKSGIIRIMFPTRIKAEGDFYTELSNAFKSLFLNPETTEFARRLFHYSYFKDGLQFRNRSFINTLPSWVFKDISSALDVLNDDFKDTNYDNYSAIKEGIVPTMIDLLNSLTLNDNLVKKLRSKPYNPKILKLTRNEDKSVTTSLNKSMIDAADFTSYDNFKKSMEELTKELKTEESRDAMAMFKGSNYSLNFNLINKIEVKATDPSQPDEIISTRIVSVKGWDKQGLPKEYTFEELVEYSLNNQGLLPKVYELTNINITPFVESGLNSTLADTKLITKIQEIKKAVSVKPDNLGTSPGTIDIIEAPEDLSSQGAIDTDDSPFVEVKAIEDLDKSDNSGTFVDDPFAEYDAAKSAETLEPDEASELYRKAQENIEKNREDQENRNQLDKDSDDFTDDEGNPICKD